MKQRISLVIFLTNTVLIQGFLSGGRHVTAYWSTNEKIGVAPLRMPEKAVQVFSQVFNSNLEDISHSSNPECEDVPLIQVPETDVLLEKSENSRENDTDSYSRTIYVVNLSYDTTNADIREHFSKENVGKVQKVFVPSNRETGKGKGFAFVTMESEEERDAAIAALNESQLHERKIYLAKAKPRGTKEDKSFTKLYVGNISYETSAHDLELFFSQWGTASDIFIPVDRDTGLPRGFAFISMGKEEAEKAVQSCAEGVELQGRNIEVNISLPRGQKAAPRKKRDEVKLYVGNIAFDTEADKIHEIFSSYGDIIDMYAPLDRFTGRPRGFAFVTMAEESAKKAIDELDGLELDGRILRVNEAQPKGSAGMTNDDELSWEENDNSW